MRIHSLQHVDFEGLGTIEQWSQETNSTISHSRMFEGDSLPPLDDFDFLIVMGGPMNVYEEDTFPWLAGEKLFIRDAIAEGKAVLGICLGAQLIADVLGAKVTRNQHREIGWFPLKSIHPSMIGIIPGGSLAMHWHGDTFTLPPGAERLAASEACANQGFIYQKRVFGLQFHLETTQESLSALIDHCREELTDGRYIQTPNEMLSQPQRFNHINQIMSSLLDHIASLAPNR